MQAQARTKKIPIPRFTKLVAAEIPNPTGRAAWLAFLGAYASLVRRLDADLRAQTGAGLNDFDVLATLGGAGGSLRMTELAERAYTSPSGMTRRVDQLVAKRLLRRGSHNADGRAVVVALTDKGIRRLLELTPAHARAVQDMFVSQLSADDLRALMHALAKLTVPATYG